MQEYIPPLLIFISGNGGCKYFFDFFEVAESDSFRVLFIAHHQVDVVEIEHIEYVVVGCVFDILACWCAHFEDLLSREDKVAAEGCVLHEHR